MTANIMSNIVMSSLQSKIHILARDQRMSLRCVHVTSGFMTVLTRGVASILAGQYRHMDRHKHAQILY
jgi:hypothetical protein